MGDTAQLNQMLQVLLEDLKVHRETRELPVYALTVAKNGPKFKPARQGGNQLKTGDSSSVEFHGMSGAMHAGGKTRITFQATSMREAAEGLGRDLERRSGSHRPDG